MVDYYLARDYSRNDRVGKSYLEYQYEDVLRGQKTKMKNVTDKSGNVLDSEIITEGQRGKDLVLTIDMDLQTALEQIIEEELKKAKSGYHPFLDRAFVTMMDPNTGEILAMAGKKYEVVDGKAEIFDFALGNMTTSYAMGSAVKGATILTGYMTGVNEPGEYIVDEPLKFAGTNPKSSWFNRGGAFGISDTYALMRSSNVYMFKTAMEIGGARYVPNGSLKIDIDAFTTMRNYFSQFGLGVKTGIDLPNEQAGYKGIVNQSEPGKLLDFAIGQFDTYTPLQLAQYVSTIANGGYRMQPHIVKEIREPISDTNKIGPIAEEIEPAVLNTLDLEPGWIERVQEGFRLVAQASEGTASSYFGDAPYKMAAKTGTAEGVYDGPLKEKNKNEMTWNVTLVGYAPYDNPEVAMAVVVPWAYEDSSSSIPINHYIGRRAMDKYFELKEQKVKEKPADAVINQEILTKEESAEPENE
jgi:cell division protein FtsI/penicillin-binding protein 2